MRRSVARYLMFGMLLIMRSVSVAVMKRFPTIDTIVEAGKFTIVEAGKYNIVKGTLAIPSTDTIVEAGKFTIVEAGKFTIVEAGK